MNAPELCDEGAIISRLCATATHWLGCDPSTIAHDTLRRWLSQQDRAGYPPQDVLRLLALGDSSMLERLTDAVCVGETYFFRHPEQFQFIVHELLPVWRGAAPRPIRVWSAGCADGVEAYSVAACLRAGLTPSSAIEVLGTDVATRAVRAARTGVYGRSAVRESAPLLFPTLRSLGAGIASVHDGLREITSFAQHNLLTAPAFGKFDLILCRNVLVYFTREAAARVVENLLSALAPNGVLIFGPMDLPQKPAALERINGAELQIFRRRSVPELARACAPQPTVRAAPPPISATRVVPPRSAAPARREEASERWVARHLLALAAIERGEAGAAADLLWALRGEARGYLPCILELALLEARRGNAALAVELMHELRGACAGLGEHVLLNGPEPMPASFYASMAELFLTRGELP